MVTISENIIIGETISHDAKSILRGVRHPFIWKKGLWYGITTSCSGDTIMYVLSSREMRQKFYQNNNLRLLGIAGSIKEAYEIVLKLVQTGYNNDCIYEMKEYLELCLQGPSTIPQRKQMLAKKQQALRDSIQELQESVAYIDWKQNFYDEVLSGKRPYVSNLIRVEE